MKTRIATMALIVLALPSLFSAEPEKPKPAPAVVQAPQPPTAPELIDRKSFEAGVLFAIFAQESIWDVKAKLGDNVKQMPPKVYGGLIQTTAYQLAVEKGLKFKP